MFAKFGHLSYSELSNFFRIAGVDFLLQTLTIPDVVQPSAKMTPMVSLLVSSVAIWATHGPLVLSAGNPLFCFTNGGFVCWENRWQMFQAATFEYRFRASWNFQKLWSDYGKFIKIASRNLISAFRAVYVTQTETCSSIAVWSVFSFPVSLLSQMESLRIKRFFGPWSQILLFCSGQLILLVGLIWATARLCCEVGDLIEAWLPPWLPMVPKCSQHQDRCRLPVEEESWSSWVQFIFWMAENISKPSTEPRCARQWLSLQRNDHCGGAYSEPLRHTLRLGIQN